jgi:GntR family transcriptional repressor for pyruvate dehydrogenase complex
MRRYSPSAPNRTSNCSPCDDGERKSSGETQIPIKPINRFKLSAVVAAQIEGMVSTGEYQPGDKLPGERELSEQFGVSRSSTREALRLLEANGVVNIVHGVGSFVVAREERESASLLVMEDATIPELFDIRRGLEGEAAALAAKRVTPAEIERFRAIIAAMHDPSVSDMDYVRLDSDLHGGIAAATRNRFFVRFFAAIQETFIIYSERVILLPGRREHANIGHAAVVEAIAKKRSATARTAMVQHLRSAERDILRQLQNESNGT